MASIPTRMTPTTTTRGNSGRRPKHQEGRIALDRHCEAGIHQRHERGDQGKEGQVSGVDEMGPSQHRSRDRRPEALGQEDRQDHGDQCRPDHADLGGHECAGNVACPQ